MACAIVRSAPCAGSRRHVAVRGRAPARRAPPRNHAPTPQPRPCGSARDRRGRHRSERSARRANRPVALRAAAGRHFEERIPRADIRARAGSRDATPARPRRCRPSSTSAPCRRSKNRSATSMSVPSGAPVSRTSAVRPASTLISVPLISPRARVRSRNRDTEAMDGSASPRNPSV